jgi:hypothetical protein
MLEGVWRSVEQLAMTDGPIPNEQESSCLLIEQIPEFHESMMHLDFIETANYQLDTHFHPDALRKEVGF